MIDWDRINELKNEIGDDAFSEVIELFVEEMEEITQHLLEQTEHPGLSDDLHLLKGSALNLGFSRFAALCAANEKLVASHDSASVDLVALVDCYSRSKEQFLQHVEAMTLAA